MWMRTPPGGIYAWENALSYSNDRNTASLCGYNSGWRLPNILELESLVNLEQQGSATWLNLQENGFVGIASNLYWSSTTSASATDKVWLIDFSNDERNMAGKNLSHRALPVRGPSITNPPAQLWKTGQTTSYETGDDGDLEEGVPWSLPRFAEPVNGAVRDNLTGLMWTQDTNTPGPQACSPSAGKFSYDAYPFIQCLNQNNYLGHSDWRLPNRKELTSLIDHSGFNPALPSGHPFTGIGSSGYWSSDTYGVLPSSGWYVDVNTGQVASAGKASNALLIWPVRGPLSLKVLLAGDGAGGINGDGISCSGTACSGVFYSGEVVTVTAYVTENSIFTGWTGCPSQSGAECVVNMGSDVTLTATFSAVKSIWDKPRSLNFGKVGVNAPSAVKYVSVKNVNETSLDIVSVNLSGENDGEFILHESCTGVSLAPGEACSIALSVNAQYYGTRRAALVVTFDNAREQSVTMKLSAKAMPAKILVKPKTLNFGKVVRSGSTTQQLTIENAGYTSLTIVSMNSTGDHGEEFAINPVTCPVLQRGQACVVTVTFSPGGEGTRTGALAVNSDAPKQGTVNVKLKGEGI